VAVLNSVLTVFAQSISELTICSPPDYANRKWYDSQSSRVYDAIDVAHLLAAQDGYDSMSKMQIWDVSQNVDRFKTGMGLMPCITPGGCDFASNRQDALNGSQTLVLQGMPLDKLHFAGETQRECQDLAGNAMSTTVIGASLISAILHGHKAFQSSPLGDTSNEESQQRPVLRNRLVRASAMEGHKFSPTNPEDLSIERLLDDAFLTSRMCACEVEQQIAESVIKVCSECGHTACSICATNPRHRYVESIASNDRRQVSSEFVSSLRLYLPSRLKLQNFPALEDPVSKSPKDKNRNNAHVKRIADAKIGSRQFTLGRFIRCEKSWRIVYKSDDVRLELSLGDRAQWLLFVDSPPNLPSNSELRKSLKTPIARGAVKESLLDVDWEIFVPSYQVHAIRLRGSTERSKSWRNQLGLPDFQTETVPSIIHVRGEDEDTSMLDGDYTHLPHCGTAEASLYKRSAEPVLYLFLDPDPIGDARSDCFVFSRDCSRKRWGESRVIVAHLDPAWRPWQMEDEDEEYVVDTTPTGSWHSMPMQLTTSQLILTAQVLSPGVPLTKLPDECTNAVTVLDVDIPERLPIEQFGDFSWALDRVKTAPSLDGWQSIDIHTQSNCLCSPAYPELLWSVDNGGRATPHEDRKAAATFERGVKSRCPIFHEQSSVTAKATRIGIGVNISSLAHRAKGRLIRSIGHAGDAKGAWRLLTDHTDGGVMRFPKFRLRSNAADAPFSGQLRLKHDLRGAQPQALTWMRNQEAGLPLTVTETEEAVHEGLGWRAEARAESTVRIRGGVLADLPSFGKTVTTIALIQSEFEDLSPGAIIEDNQSMAMQLSQLIDSAATLVVCPPHIAIQWQTELELFLGDEQAKKYNVCVIRDFADLRRLSIGDIQQSRVIVVSWTVLADDDYISELAWVTAMPEPANSSCRAYDAWMDGVSKELPSQVHFLQSMDLHDFAQATHNLLEERLSQPEFQATLPLRLQHGSSYQSYQTFQTANAHKKSAKNGPSVKRKTSALNGKAVPLLHMFRFNRLVVDEYHYLNDYKKMKNMFTAISVKKVAAHKRWILSGTPALANFTDIDNISSFLGVRLGRFAVQASKLTPLEEFLVNDQTAVERFLSKTEVMSQAWHRARHDRAQEFLDQFVRQNEASLGHIPCHEELRAIDMDLAHHAVYLELSQHLNSQRMQVKRLRNKGESDRVSRLNASLNNSKTAEDALLKAALLYETSAGESGLDTLVRKRSEQRNETEREISRLMRAFEWHKRTGFKGLKPTDPKKAEKEENTVPKLWASFTQDIRKHAWLGDFDATLKAKLLLSKAEAKPTSGGLEELKGVSKDKMIKEAKTIMSHLRDSCVELALRTRSERFISNVKALLQPLCEGSEDSISCDAEHCQQTATISEIYLASQCGHLTCRPCLLARGDDENCVVTGCSCTIKAVSLIKATDLGSTPEKVTGHSFGRKMDSIARLLKKLPGNDQGLVFAPNDETIVMLGEVLDHHDIAYYAPNGNSRQAARIIEEFKASVHQDSEDRPKVLLLNLTSETAAGV
jgi:SNF2 family DNA or RNA helicase